MGWLQEVIMGRESRRDRMVREAKEKLPQIVADADAACAIEKRLPASQSPSLGNLTWSAINEDSGLQGTTGKFCTLISGDRQEIHTGDTTLIQTGDITSTVQGDLTSSRQGSETITLVGDRTFSHVGNYTMTRTGTETTTNFGAVTRTFIAPYTEVHGQPSTILQPTNWFETVGITFRAIGFIQANVGMRVRTMGSDNRVTVQKLDVVGIKTEAGMFDTEMKVLGMKTKALNMFAGVLKAKVEAAEVGARAIEANAGPSVQGPPTSLGAQ